MSSVSKDSFRKPEKPFGDASNLCLLGCFVNWQFHMVTRVAYALGHSPFPLRPQHTMGSDGTVKETCRKGLPDQSWDLHVGGSGLLHPGRGLGKMEKSSPLHLFNGPQFCLCTRLLTKPRNGPLSPSHCKEQTSSDVTTSQGEQKVSLARQEALVGEK